MTGSGDSVLEDFVFALGDRLTAVETAQAVLAFLDERLEADQRVTLMRDEPVRVIRRADATVHLAQDALPDDATIIVMGSEVARVLMFADEASRSSLLQLRNQVRDVWLPVLRNNESLHGHLALAHGLMASDIPSDFDLATTLHRKLHASGSARTGETADARVRVVLHVRVLDSGSLFDYVEAAGCMAEADARDLSGMVVALLASEPPWSEADYGAAGVEISAWEISN